MGTRSVELVVNDVPIEMDYFVQGFVDHVMGGIIGSLKRTGQIKDLDVSVRGDEVTVNLNHNAVPVNAFVNKIVRNTITGMISSLKGVGQINNVSISIRR